MTSHLGNKPEIAAHRRETVLTGLMLASTVGTAGVGLWEIARIGEALARTGDWSGVMAQLAFAIAYAVLVFGSVAYLLSREGYLRRQSAHSGEDQAVLDALLAGDVPSLTILVPSYREELAVVRRTLLSAALLEYPGRRVVLLIDDPWRPRDAATAASLSALRQLAGSLQERFDILARRFRQEADQLQERLSRGVWDGPGAVEQLARCYEDAAGWTDAEIARAADGDHADALLCSLVLQPRRDRHRQRARELRGCASASPPAAAVVLAELRRLVALFRVELTSFERKRYENLSHEANKAMNLNTYIGLMGGSYREVHAGQGTGLQLRRTTAGPGTLDVPDADFVLTLDADSVLASDYALRLVHLMTRPGNERVAVAQTPYSAFPGAPGLLERVAGAQTDIQYLVHQGFTRHDATFWVGANAVLRKAALEDIATYHVERGHRVVKYVQDRTPIEDTESSIDLADRGWTLVNYPERLAYSATPPDFGALLIQRRRWANGGLIILPKALRYLLRGPGSPGRVAEAVLRVHYLASVALVNAAFLLIMFGPFDRNLAIAWVPLSMAPYMLAYARDLVHCGYRWRDFLHVYALNIVLLPVNLGGTLRSLHQAITGQKSPFVRTPKVTGRTAAPGGYVLAEYALVAAGVVMTIVQALRGNVLGVAVIALYAGFAAYALVRFVGLRDSVEDLRLWLRPQPQPVISPDHPHAAAGSGQLVPLARAHALAGRGRGQAPDRVRPAREAQATEQAGSLRR